MFKLNCYLIIPLLLITHISFAQKPNPDRQWFMYRGIYASGVLDQANLPETWDVETDKNIAWKTEIPGLGHSCPVVWGDNVFVNSAISGEDKSDVKTGIYGSIGSVQDSSIHNWNLYCIDKNTGKIKWEKT